VKRPGLASRIGGARLAALLLAVLPLGALGLAAVAGERPAAGAAAEPPYPHGSFQGDCSECHGDEGWKPARISRKFDHAKRSGFALTGAHAALKCASCHGTLDFTQPRKLCASCHQDPHLGELGPDCARCHTPRSFLDRAGMTRMHQLTRFPLAGAHAGLDCESCHPQVSQGHLRFGATGADCYSCHRADYAATTSPAHAAAGFPTDCVTCHSSLAWRPARFDHAGATDCYSCHKADYDRTTNPAHAAAGFPTACATCHTTRAWQPSTFDHSATAFALTGAHRQTLCASCHGSPWQNTLPTDCYACHKPAFDATAAPAHLAGGIPTTCTGCHNTTAWQPSTFDHGATAFPLTGAHVQALCASCHGSPWQSTLATDCYSCHQPAYAATAAPAHAAGGIPTTCLTCHSTVAWQPATFNHATTAFPLTGAHVQALCASCHGSPWQSTLATDCYSCHQPAYDATNAPGHAASGIPTACLTCHNTVAWQPATFNHATTAFPLTGAHVQTPCGSCHGNPWVNQPAADCYSCHKAAYDGTTDPAHAAAGFPTTCATCHTTSTWSGATFDHTWFPITSGRHSGLSCSTCHTVPTNYATFSCLTSGCHSQSSTDGHHDGVSGYRYDSAACYSCHPRGSGG
jgi:predicted CXXCH cytochrome family protein